MANSYYDNIKYEAARILVLGLSLTSALAMADLFKHLFKKIYGDSHNKNFIARTLFTIGIFIVAIIVAAAIYNQNDNYPKDGMIKVYKNENDQ